MKKSIHNSVIETTKGQPVTGSFEGLKVAMEWNVDKPAGPQTHELCKVLAKTGKIYRDPQGVLLTIDGESISKVMSPVSLEGFLRTNEIVVQVLNGGNPSGFCVPQADLKILIATLGLQRELPVIDAIINTVTYTASMQLTKPGYNDGGDGQRYYYVGKAVTPIRQPKRIKEFLGAMHFKTEADRTNALAAAITVKLRHMFPGGKPFICVTANRSHAGKDTVIDFAAGLTKKEEVAYEAADWPLQNNVTSILSDPFTGVVTVGNIRREGEIIESAFLERILTSKDPLLQSSKMRGNGVKRTADFVLCCSANQGKFSADLMNRSLLICLELVGDIEKRKSPLGDIDIRRQYLPEHAEEIDAELCGMIETWKEAGCPLDTNVRHPMSEWAKTVGGILKVNGFEHFLENWTVQKSSQDKLIEALAIVAHAAQQEAYEWIRISTIVKIATDHGVLCDIIDKRHKGCHKAAEREMGKALKNYLSQNLHYVDEDGNVSTYVLQSFITRNGGGRNTAPAKHYSFALEKAKEVDSAAPKAQAVKEVNAGRAKRSVKGKPKKAA